MSVRRSAGNTNRLIILLCLVPALGLGGCIDYLKRHDGVTLGSGDAKNWNAVVHTADPWPPYAGDTQISGDGQRTARVMQRYVTGAGGAGAAAQGNRQGASSQSGSAGAGAKASE